VTLLDVDATYEVTKSFASMAANSPFVGARLQGRVAATIVGGVIRHDARVAPEPKKTRGKK
jgi:dihydroorotase-like cyclic amidohydrolase